MRPSSLVWLLLLSVRIVPAADIGQSWAELQSKREALTASHQEFEISRTFKIGEKTQASLSSVTVDLGNTRWRERSVSGSADRTRIFDGQELYQLEDGTSQYERTKRFRKGEVPQPNPYNATDLNFSKATDRGLRPCGLSHVKHECVTWEIAVKPWIRSRPGAGSSRMLNGSRLLMFDTSTGLLLFSRTVANIEYPNGVYQSDVTYTLKRMTYNGTADEALFRLPPGATEEVKELPRWNADRIKKQLAEKTAPDLVLTDMQGRTVKLSDLKGKTVLLDFWATWCGPCLSDAPSLDKLYEKYGRKELAVIGISVERPVVQKFLSGHPHQYPIALTTENEMPRAYQIGVFPTYIVIDSDGKVASATEGAKGFSELRKLLKKAGLEAD
jgi:thiol-disulfide isomerase/thioredoxin